MQAQWNIVTHQGVRATERKCQKSKPNISRARIYVSYSHTLCIQFFRNICWLYLQNMSRNQGMTACYWTRTNGGMKLLLTEMVKQVGRVGWETGWESASTIWMSSRCTDEDNKSAVESMGRYILEAGDRNLRVLTHYFWSKDWE